MTTAVRNKPRFGPAELQRVLEWEQRDRDYAEEIEAWLPPRTAWVARQMVLRGSPSSDPRLLEPFCSAYLVWHHQPDPVGGATVAEDYFAEFPDRLRGREDWYQAQRRSWIGLWEIETVDPDGWGLQAVDRLTGERRYVFEFHDGQFAKPSYTILGRVVDIDAEISVFSGTDTIPLPLHAGALVRDAFMRELFSSCTKLKPATLRDDVLFLMLKEKWYYAANLWLDLWGTDRFGRLRDLSPAQAKSPDGRAILEGAIGLLIDGM